MMSEETNQTTLADAPAIKKNGKPAVAGEEREGYQYVKRIGWIPEGWESAKLGALSRIRSGSTPSRSQQERYFEDGGTPWVKTLDLTNGPIASTEESITEAALSETSCKIFPKGTILVAMYGGLKQIGRTGILRVEAATNQAMSAIEVDRRRALPEYLLLWLNFRVVYWRMFAASSRKDPNITGQDVSDFPVALPPLPEQRKIARILGAWDRALADLDTLIEAKRLRKKGLAQRLLTGQVRVPGFENEPWYEVAIGSLFKSVRRPVDWDDNRLYRLVSLKRGAKGLFWRAPLYGHQIRTKNLMKTRTGDFLISRMQVVHGATGVTTEEFDNAYVSNSYLVLVPRKQNAIDTAFFAELSKRPHMFHLAYLSSYGVHIEKMTFNPRFYFKSVVSLPRSTQEQRRIVDVLRAADAEIAALEARRDALARQKRGLMQRLLTGEIRVTPDAEDYETRPA